MKKNIFLLSAVIIFLSACSNTEKPVEEIVVDNEVSNYYNEVVIKQSGDLAGFVIGQKQSESKKVLKTENLVLEEEDFLSYKLSDTYTISDYSLYFNDDKELYEINLDTKVFDEEDNHDNSGASELFNDLKKEFMEKFGSKYLEESDGENVIMFWESNEKHIQLILDQSEVHVYIETLTVVEVTQ